jgi:hypothetical protein
MSSSVMKALKLDIITPKGMTWLLRGIHLQTLGVKPLSREGNSQTGDWMIRDTSPEMADPEVNIVIN